MIRQRNEEEVDKMIEEMINRTKGNYITQACAFNKNCPRQMDLLKKALMSSVSFSGLVKEALTVRFCQPTLIYGQQSQGMGMNPVFAPPVEVKKKNVGNFL